MLFQLFAWVLPLLTLCTTSPLRARAVNLPHPRLEEGILLRFGSLVPRLTPVVLHLQRGLIPRVRLKALRWTQSVPSILVSRWLLFRRLFHLTKLGFRYQRKVLQDFYLLKLYLFRSLLLPGTEFVLHHLLPSLHYSLILTKPNQL